MAAFKNPTHPKKTGVLAARWFGTMRRLQTRAEGDHGGQGGDTGSGSGHADEFATNPPFAPVQNPEQVPGVGPSPRILIVDDEPSMRRVCAFALRGAGWRPETEGSSLAALARVLGGERYDALVLDYAMPELDGLEFLSRIDELAPQSRPPVLMASAHADGATAWTALRLGVWDFLAKPLTPEELRRRVRRLLERPAAAERGEIHARALQLATRREWTCAREVLVGLSDETTELMRGLLFQLEGDQPAAADSFSRAHWWPNWDRQGPEIWAELSRRLDAAT